MTARDEDELEGIKADVPEERDTFVTPEKMAEFVVHLSECGNVTEAASKASVNRTALYRYRKEDEEFAAAWAEAEQLGVRGLEDEAKRRAYRGTLKPVFYQGVECGAVREYSDVLLMFLLKAHDREKYGDQQKIDVKGDMTNRPAQADPVSVMEAMRAFKKDGNG